jgi:tetratricopeptide (TPR) repeat protein
LTTRVISFGFLLALACSALAETSEIEKGIAAFNAGKYSLARQLLQGQTSDPDAVAFLALTDAATGNCKEALPKLTEAAKSASPKIGRLLSLASAKCEIASGDLPQASAVLQELQRKFPDDADTLYLTAKLHMKAFNDATLQMFQRTPASYRVHQLSAEIFEVQNRYSDAIAEYRKAIELNPSAPDLHYRLGRAILLDSHSAKAMEEAAAEFRSELKLSPEDAACEFQLGQIARAQGDGTAARSHFERALSLSPGFPEAMIALGKIYSQTKQYDKAIAVLTQAAALQADNEAAHYALMTAYRDSGDLEKAKKENAILNGLQKEPEGEFSEFLKKLGAQQPKQ